MSLRPLRNLLPEDAPPPAKPSRNGQAPAKSREAAGRFQTLNNFVDVAMRNLNPAASAVWLVLYRDAREGIARTSQSDIARRTGFSLSTIRRAIKELQAAGVLELVSKGNSFQSCSAYRVLSGPATADTHDRSTPVTGDTSTPVKSCNNSRHR